MLCPALPEISSVLPPPISMTATRAGSSSGRSPHPPPRSGAGRYWCRGRWKTGSSLAPSSMTKKLLAQIVELVLHIGWRLLNEIARALLKLRPGPPLGGPAHVVQRDLHQGLG